MNQFNALLKNSSVKQNSTHTRMPDKALNIYGGSFAFDDEDEFYNQLYNYIFIQGNKEYLTEKQNPSGTFAIDLDFRYSADVKTRPYKINRSRNDNDKIDDFVLIILDVMKKVCNCVDTKFKCYTMLKPRVNCLEDGSKTKDGMHFIFTVQMNKNLKNIIRSECIKEFEKMIDLPLINDWESVFDAGIVNESINWTVYGCQKPANEAYEVVRVYDCELDQTDNEWMTNVNYNPIIGLEEFKDLSVRKERPILEANPSYVNKLSRTKSPTSVVEIHEENKRETKDKYVELLFNIIGNGEHIDFQKWFQIAGILKSNGYKFDILEEYTAIVDANNPKTEKIWDSIGRKPMSIYGLQNIAKEVNPDEYFKWLSKHNEIITFDILQRGSNDVSQFIAKTLKDVLVYCKSSWYECKNNLWIIVDNPSSTIVSAVQTEIDKLLKVKTDNLNKLTDEEEKSKERKTISTINDLRRQVCSCMRQYREFLQGYLLNNEFSDLLDMNKYQIAFKNGILDLKTNSFRNYISPDDFITRTLPFEYRKGDNVRKAYVRECLKKICNYNEKHLNYYLSMLGASMTGDADKMQEFYYLRGQKACNGKSVIFEILSEIMPCYVRKMGRDVFDSKNTTLHKEIAIWRGMRIGWANEISAKLDGEMLKDVSDGKPISFKALFKNADSMPISFKPFIVSNHSPTIDSDAGVKRRMRIAQFDSEFVENLEIEDFVNCRFKRDNNFGEKMITEYKYDLLELIFEYSQKFWENKCKMQEYPAEWKQEVEEALSQNDTFSEWFLETFEFGSGDDFIMSEYNLKKLFEVNRFKVKFNDIVKKNKWPITFDRNTRKWAGLHIKEKEKEPVTNEFQE